ncbi:unnamed protein product [Somion occarium]|uniref:Enoyl reductase (ER) domain-containing protein n=1 Tax=Somion occarium TaxID=3059160 RepID=A0ABP1DD02_9APHY
MTVPDKMQALITQANKTTKVETVPTPDIDDDEVLVKTVAIALNHTDWKHIEFINNPGTIVGCDFSGTVVKVGKAVTTLFEGDHVAGFTHGGTFKDLGAFAEYVKSPADLVWKVPGGTLSHEQAATFGCAFYTAVQALFNPNRLALIEPPGEAAAPEWVLINGGTASVGMFAIQLARIAGYEVLAVASKKPELAKSLGANAVVDYKDPEAVTQIRHATHEGIHSGLDAIATDDTQEFSIRSFGPGEGKLIVTLNAYKGAQELRPDVEIQSTSQHAYLSFRASLCLRHLVLLQVPWCTPSSDVASTS